MRYFTTYDGQVWINKDDLLKFLSEKGKGKKDLTKELKVCYYKCKENKNGNDTR